MKCTNLIGSLSIGFLVAGISPISLIGEDYDRGEHSKIVTFSAPGAGTGAGQGTYAIGVNAEGSIVGYYIDENGGTMRLSAKSRRPLHHAGPRGFHVHEKSCAQ